MRHVLLVFCIVATSFLTGTAQHHRLPPLASPDAQGSSREPDTFEQEVEHQRAKQLNKDRQAALKRDTDKLLQLATELKQYVDKTNENVLSLDVVRKAEQIEKLAHSVREKMKE